MRNYRKKLIEVALPLAAINAASAREKSIRHGHPSTLHLWWARRPLAACRAVLFAQLVDDPSSVPEEFPDKAAQERECRRLFDIVEQLVKWENSNDPRVIGAARREIARSVARALGVAAPRARAEVDAFLAERAPPAVDPFCGGGSIPLEAQRLGLRAHGSDLNPVAVLITKALVEMPPRFAGLPPVNPEARARFAEGAAWRGAGAEGLAEDVRHYGRWMREEARKRIGHLYPRARLADGSEATVIAWLWARTVASPNPAARGAHVPLVRSFVLSSKKGKRAWVEPVVDPSGRAWRFTVRSGSGTPPEGTVGRRGGRCLLTGAPMPFDHIRSEGRAGRMGQRLMAVVAEGKRGRVYLEPTAEMEEIARQAEPAWRPDGSLPEKALGFRIQQYGMRDYADLFTPRQLAALTTFSDLVSEARERVKRDVLGAPASRRPAREDAGETPALPGEALPEHRGWHSRGYLPHFDAEGLVQSVAFRLADGVPRDLLRRWRAELRGADRAAELRERIARYEDAGHGACHLRQPEIARLVQDALLHFDGDRYRLLAWCVMPNHVHVLIEQTPDHRLADVVQSWKSFTAKRANRMLGRDGPFWARDYFDRYIRDESHFEATRRYIHENPVRAGLCAAAADWPWSSLGAPASRRPTREARDDENAGGTPALPGEAYADAVATYLGLCVGRAANRLSSLAFWNSIGEKIEQTLARQALPMVWDFCEANPFSDSTGGFVGQVDYLAKVVEASPANVQPAAVTQADAARNEPARPLWIVATDPPYYDNIGYADLSDFFYVWLRRALTGIHPDLFRTLLTPKTAELVATPYRFGGDKEKARRFFETGLGRAITHMRAAQAPDYPMTLFYAYKQAETKTDGGGNGATASTGWETMLSGIVGNGFTMTGTWPVRTERDQGLKTGTNALASSIVLACRPRAADAPETTRRDFAAALRRELPDAIRRLQAENIAPVDLAQAAIGPGMAVFSRYARVLEADGAPMPVRAALAEINRVLDETLAEAEGEMDIDTRFCVAWFEQYGTAERAYGEAEVLFTAKNTSFAGLEEAGVIVGGGGKVRLRRREELEKDWDPARDRRLVDWECAQHLVRAMTAEAGGGVAEAARLAHAMGPARAENARALAYRLYTVSERKGWTGEALACNILVASWPQIRARAAELAAGGPAQAEMGV